MNDATANSTTTLAGQTSTQEASVAPAESVQAAQTTAAPEAATQAAPETTAQTITAPEPTTQTAPETTTQAAAALEPTTQAAPETTTQAAAAVDTSFFRLDEDFQRWDGNDRVEECKMLLAQCVQESYIAEPAVANALLNQMVDFAQGLIADHFEVTEAKAKENREMQEAIYKKLVSSEAERMNLELKTDIEFFSDSPNRTHYMANLSTNPWFKTFMAENKHLVNNTGRVSVESVMSSNEFSVEDKAKFYREESMKITSSKEPIDAGRIRALIAMRDELLAKGFKL